MNRIQDLRRIPMRLVVVVGVLLATLFVVGTQPASALGAPKTVGGELHCPTSNRVSGVWMLGSESGWHGGDYAYSSGVDKRPAIGKYSATFRKGERVKTWIRCSLVGSKHYTESYSEWTVGGDTRHICAKKSGWVCVPGKAAGCVLYAVLSKNPISIWKCTLKG